MLTKVTKRISQNGYKRCAQGGAHNTDKELNMAQTVLVVDFGGQYNQLIARRVREQGVYCDLMPCEMSIEKIKEYSPIGIIFTGGPNSVYEAESPKVDKEIFGLGIPVLGICYGSQLTAQTLGGTVERASASEYGKAEINYVYSKLTKDMPVQSVCWMSHTDRIVKLPEGFKKNSFKRQLSLCGVRRRGA